MHMSSWDSRCTEFGSSVGSLHSISQPPFYTQKWIWPIVEDNVTWFYLCIANIPKFSHFIFPLFALIWWWYLYGSLNAHHADFYFFSPKNSLISYISAFEIKIHPFSNPLFLNVSTPAISISFRLTYSGHQLASSISLGLLILLISPSIVYVKLWTIVNHPPPFTPF